MLRERRRHAHFKLNGRLDRKSSRGMIYENEELRLRTININAEVERGQSDIKRLRRENEHLRREIWTLRDECDRLNKRFKAKLVGNSYDHAGIAGCSGRRGSCSGIHQGSNSNSGDSDSCDTCKGENDDRCVDNYEKYTPNDCCIDGSCKLPPSSTRQQQQANKELAVAINNAHASQSNSKNLQGNFDHLSVVSEETLSNSEVAATAISSGNLLTCPSASLNRTPTSLPSLVRPLTPLTPVELVANELHNLQSAVPPLSYFENVVQQHMAPNTGNTPESAKTTNSGKTVIQTNGWDYNLQSPFTQHNYPTSLTTSRSPAPVLTTFVPNSALSPHYVGDQVLSDRAPKGETIAITTSPRNGTPTINNPTHFFAPLKPRLKVNTALANRNASKAVAAPPLIPQSYDPPDVFVANALATPYQRPDMGPSSEAPAEHAASHHPSPQSPSPNLETILNDIETISEDILAIQLEKNKSRDNLNEDKSSIISATQVPKHLHRADKNMKPYRSEMNLLLSYDGTHPTITPATSDKTFPRELRAPSTEQPDTDNTITARARARSLERERTESPSPNVPDPMAPFPYNRTYIGFDKFTAAMPKAPISAAQFPIGSGGGFQPETPNKPIPPTPPTRTLASLQMHSSSQQVPQSGFPTSTLTPNKSHLYTAIANAAAAKRAQFRAKSSHVTQSLDTDRLITVQTEEEAQAVEASRRKARRVSIVCGDSSREDTDIPAEEVNKAKAIVDTLGSCADLQAPNPIILHLKQTSHSTPSSPHAPRRGSISSLEPPIVGSHHNLSQSRHITRSQSHQRSGSFTVPHRKCSQDSTRGISNAVSDLAAAAAAVVASRSRCSRRNSDGTLASGQQRVANSSVRHHHHHHHQHQRTPSLMIANIHANRHSRQESNLETGTSISDRNSNSISSSGDSTASFSTRSQRRKISISSHGGGKIPWCGCWGNGCI